jgi:uncharacterized protein YukJ
MLANQVTTTSTHPIVGALTLTKVKEQNNESTYFQRAVSGSDVYEFTITVNHTIPNRGSSGESHLCKYVEDKYTDGLLVSSYQHHYVSLTRTGIQPDTAAASNALVADFFSQIESSWLNRES